MKPTYKFFNDYDNKHATMRRSLFIYEFLKYQYSRRALPPPPQLEDIITGKYQ